MVPGTYYRNNKSIFVLAFIGLLSMSLSCTEAKPDAKDPLENPSNYYELQGRVYKLRDYWDWRHLETSRDVFYEYHLEKDPPLKGALLGTNLFGLHKGDLISVIVSKKDPSENYYNGPGVLLDTILEFDRY